MQSCGYFRSIKYLVQAMSRFHPPLHIETVLGTKFLLSPASLEADRGGESTQELRAILKRTTFSTEARLAAIVQHYMTKYSQNEADAIRMILSERDQGR